MPYDQFTTLRAVKKQFGLKIENKRLFSTVEPVEPSDWLKQTISKSAARRMAFFSEKSRSEAIVFPILLELNNRNDDVFNLYSGAFIDADKEKGLNGECDFVLGLGKQNIEVEAPIFCIVEAKDNDIDLGVPQCIAQMYGALLYNKQDENAVSVIYGGVTTGDTWLFLRLENDTVYIDEGFYYLAKLEDILGVLQSVIKMYI